jgi:hypothetical protein
VGSLAPSPAASKNGRQPLTFVSSSTIAIVCAARKLALTAYAGPGLDPPAFELQVLANRLGNAGAIVFVKLLAHRTGFSVPRSQGVARHERRRVRPEFVRTRRMLSFAVR